MYEDMAKIYNEKVAEKMQVMTKKLLSGCPHISAPELKLLQA